MKLLVISTAVLILNLPFGYWRGNVDKFSIQWFLAIHMPIPIIVFLRIFFGLGFAFITYPVILAADISGQIIGAKIYSYRKKIPNNKITSCLFLDLFQRSVPLN